ncbi:reverse transcriptase family protein [Neorhodopirellula pilleata]|nr:hypothetical protein [Neorhodopirellula pilleata]
MQSKRKSKDYIPVTVPFSAESPSAKASRAGELDEKSTIEISDWAKASVWTNRMLNALTVGVRGGKWHALIDKVYSELNLFASARKVVGKKGAAGVDRQSTEDFSENERAELRRLSDELKSGTYRPQAVRRVQILKLGSSQTRPLGIPTPDGSRPSRANGTGQCHRADLR